MPHIHTRQNQHDMTISAYIVWWDSNDWRCLVHFHKKVEVLMQIGGHIELDETPWQTVAHELKEESGYNLEDLDVLQYTSDSLKEAGNITHPTPLLVNTHNVGNDHDGTVLKDVLYIYEFLLAHRETMNLIPASDYSLDKPVSIGMTYKRGAPEKQ
jgi:8-oxo-dGTP pyrophosphatase MutT (NUDIX family)